MSRRRSTRHGRRLRAHGRQHARPPRRFRSPSIRSRAESEHSGGFWTLPNAGEPEIFVKGTSSGPRPEALVVIPWLLAHWTEFETGAVAKLDEMERNGWITHEPYVDLSRRPTSGRWASAGMVEIVDPPHFDVLVSDECFITNGWPYGDWVVGFRWGQIAKVEMGWRHRMTVWDSDKRSARAPG